MDRKKYTLHQRNGVWQIRFTANIKGQNILIRESLRTKDYDEAVKAADERAKEIYEDYEFKFNKSKLREFTVDQAFGFYYEEHAQFCPHKYKTIRALKNLLKYFDKNIPFYLLNEEDLSSFVSTKRKEGVCNATINRNLTILSAIYNLCKKRRIAVPDVDIKNFKLKERSYKTLYVKTKEDLQRIIECAEDWFKPVIWFAVLTGYRLGTILDLKWTDIENGQINVWVKNVKYDGGILQTKHIFPELQSLLDSIPKVSEYVFTKNGEKIKRVDYDWIKAQKKANHPYINFHALRHTHATWLLEKTNNIKLVSESLGHSNIIMTARYAHIIKSSESNIMQEVFAN